MVEVIYDSQCRVCTQLADFMKNKYPDRFTFISLELFFEKHKDKFWSSNQFLDINNVLRVYSDGVLYEDEKAWEFLVLNYPDLRGLSWLFQKIGLSSQSGNILKSVGQGIRWFCRSCRKRLG